MKLKRNRMLSLLLTLVLAFSAVAVGLPGLVTIARADTWSGTLSDPGSEYVVSGNTVHLYSARAMVWFLNRIYNGTSFSGQTVYLDVDVNLNNVNLATSVFPYNDSRYFEGTFDGQNHTISNFKMEQGNHRVAMFRQTRNATFKNLNFTNVSISSSGNNNGHAVLVGYHNSGNLTFENVHVQSGSISGYQWIGALAGEVAENSGRILTMTNCSNGATITGSNTRIGGLAGSSLPAVYATNCSNTGNVTASSTDVGGIVGWIEDDASTFDGCSNSGRIQGSDSVGGILGYFGNKNQDQKLTLKNNTNTGAIVSPNNRAGGIAGLIDSDNNAHIISDNKNYGSVTGITDAGGIVASNAGFGTWTNNYNYGTVSCSNDNAGGILGEVEDDLQTFTNCYNVGNVTGKNSVGGILGYGNSAHHTFAHCGNSGAITSTGDCAGGIYGYGADSQAVHEECWNIGTVKAYNHAGGITGRSNNHLTFRRCFNAGTIDTYNHSNNGYHGGIVGQTGNLQSASSSNPQITDCFNWGEVKGGSHNAGMVAYVLTGNKNIFGGGGNENYYIINSYSTGNVHDNTAKAMACRGGNGVTNCYKTVDPGNGWGDWKTDQEMIDYSNFTLSSNFCKNTWGVKIGSTTYYYPILTWYRNMFTFTSVFEDDPTNTHTTYNKTAYNGSFSVPNPTRTGYTIDHWYNVANTAQTLTPGATMRAGVTSPTHQLVVTQSFTDLLEVTNTTTYHLVWTPHSFTVTFNGNGATSGGMSPQGFTYDVPQALAANGFQREFTVTYHYNDGVTANGTAVATSTIAGWATSANGAKVYNDKEVVSNLTAVNGGSVPLYAVWNPGSVTPPTPAARTTHAFVAWCTDPALNNQISGAYTPAANADLYAKWLQVVTDDSWVLDFGLPVQLNVVSNDAPGAALKSVTASDTRFTAVKDGTQITFTPSAALNEAVSFTYTVTYGGADYTASVTVIPANNVYYEESFIQFASAEGAPAWQAAGTAFTGKFQNGQRPGDATSPVYGFDAAYDDANETTYSLGSAKYVTVKKGDAGATATFTFTGTGFDLYSVTDNASGLAFVDIYKVENGTETNIESSIVNTYFGYRYGRLYLDGDKLTLTETATPVYYAPAGKTADTFFIQGTTRGQTAPTYYNASGTIVAGTAADPTKAAYAYGWVAGSNAVNGVYQVPVISRTGLDYGTYKVVVEPRYSARQDLTGSGKYNFYVDAVRVYDPINPAQITAGTAAYDAYQANGELNASYQEVRGLLISGGFGSTEGHGTAGVAFLEEGKGENLLQDYADIGPKNEVYLARGQAIAFHLTTASAVKPAKVSIGLKMANGATGQATVYAGSNSAPLTLQGATELYRDVTGVINWQQTTGDVWTTANPIIIANTSTGDVVISITKVKWSYSEPVAAAGARALQFSFAPQDLVTASAVLRQAKAQTVAPDASQVQLQWNTRMIRRGGVATLVITAPASFEKAYVNGTEIAGYTENADGTRSWRYDYSSSAVGKHGFDVTLTDANGYSTAAVSAGNVEVVASTNGQGTLTLQGLLELLFGGFFRALRALFQR